MEKVKEIIKKVCTREVIFYAIFGVLTTLVNVGTFSLLNLVFHVEENLSNNIGIVVAVLFAYATNRKIVFHSEAITRKEKWIEFGKFILGRAFTMVVESAGFFLLFNICHIQKMISKCFITILVIILNFFVSKFFAFRKKK